MSQIFVLGLSFLFFFEKRVTLSDFDFDSRF